MIRSIPRHIKSLSEKANSLRAIQRDIDAFVMEFISENEQKILDDVRDQLYKGLYADGGQIRPVYATSTVVRKLRKRQPVDRVTLRDTGDFYESAFIEKDIDQFYIQFEDEKTRSLTEKYSTRIAGVSDESLSWIKEMVRDRFITRVNQLL